MSREGVGQGNGFHHFARGAWERRRVRRCQWRIEVELRRLPTGQEFECDCTTARALVRAIMRAWSPSEYWKEIDGGKKRLGNEGVARVAESSRPSMFEWRTKWLTLRTQHLQQQHCSSQRNRPPPTPLTSLPRCLVQHQHQHQHQHQYHGRANKWFDLHGRPRSNAIGR
jgi:hypothetical protein